MSRRIRAAALAVLVPVALLGACRSDQSGVEPDLASNDGLFRRFVAIGTSISAGLQSGGINDSTQRRAFPVLVAAQANAPFAYPSLQGRGCPAPLVNNAPPVRLGNQPANTPCDLRSLPVPAYLNSLAVPGLEARDLFSNIATPLSTYERLQTFFLGGRIPVQAVMEAQPTLISVELGSNEILGALLASNNPGNPDSVVPLAVFQAQFTRFADSLDKLGAKVVVTTVPDVTVIPYSSLGAIYWCLKNGGCPAPLPPANPQFQLNPLFTVNNNCAPAGGGIGLAVRVPWTVGVAGFLGTAQGAAFNLDCGNTLQVVDAAELANITNSVAAYNAFITGVAAERGYAVVDLNALLQARLAAGEVPPFPDLSQAATGGGVRFGPYFSLDGFHPANAAHELIAREMIDVINETFGTAVPNF